MPNYIAGVGDEVLLTLIGLLFILVVSVTVFSTTCRNYVHRLFHPRLPANAPNQAEPGHFNPDFCPICLNAIQLAVETNCGHLYCGGCLAAYNVDERLETLPCPLCRQSVIMFFTAFSQNELTADPGSPIGRQAANITRMIQRYNHRFSGTPRSLWEIITDAPILLRHLWNQFFSVNGLMNMFRVRILLCFLAAVFYLFSPFDAVPEAVYGVIGFLDDIFVIFVILVYISILFRRFMGSHQ